MPSSDDSYVGIPESISTSLDIMGEIESICHFLNRYHIEKELLKRKEIGGRKTGRESGPLEKTFKEFYTELEILAVNFEKQNLSSLQEIEAFNNLFREKIRVLLIKMNDIQVEKRSASRGPTKIFGKAVEISSLRNYLETLGEETQKEVDRVLHSSSDDIALVSVKKQTYLQKKYKVDILDMIRNVYKNMLAYTCNWTCTYQANPETGIDNRRFKEWVTMPPKLFNAVAPDMARSFQFAGNKFPANTSEADVAIELNNFLKVYDSNTKKLYFDFMSTRAHQGMTFMPLVLADSQGENFLQNYSLGRWRYEQCNWEMKDGVPYLKQVVHLYTISEMNAEHGKSLVMSGQGENGILILDDKQVKFDLESDEYKEHDSKIKSTAANQLTSMNIQPLCTIISEISLPIKDGRVEPKLDVLQLKSHIPHLRPPVSEEVEKHVSALKAL